MIPSWEHYPHEADMGVRGYGATPAQAFEQAAVAMTAVMLDPGTINPVKGVSITCQAPDDEMLLVDWLNALVFEMATRKMVFCRFEISLQNHCLSAQAWGEPLDPDRHAPAVEIKGATFTDLGVRPVNGGWLAQCVVDV